MNRRIAEMRKYYIGDKVHHQYRQAPIEQFALAKEFEAAGLSDIERAQRRLQWMLQQEQPVVFPQERISILRTVPVIPKIFSEQEWEDLNKNHRIHETGQVNNTCPGYSTLIDIGFAAKRVEIEEAQKLHEAKGNDEGVAYLTTLVKVLDAIEAFAERYRVAAVAAGNTIVAESFAQIPQQPPRTFLQALQFFRLLYFCLWESDTYQNTIGRFDQYMFPYYQADIAAGLLDKESALVLLQEFFISFNIDSDLYAGVQRGDNGQSLMLGGLDSDGNDVFNELSELCMEASLQLKLIDPKINLRVHKDTPLALYELGTQMTKQGLGFPQYSNDEIVIPALKRWGYAHEDATNYVVAACWEFIIPDIAMEIVNIDALSFTRCVLDALPEINACSTYDEFAERVKKKIFARTSQMCEDTKNVYMEPAPVMSLMTTGCVEQASDIRNGSVYNNYGFHSSGLSSAADSLAAIKKYVYDEKTLDKETLLQALAADFNGYDELFSLLRYEAPKMGNDDDFVDSIGTQLLDWFADSLEGRKNDRGGIFRAGTGSAMYYLWHGNELGASPDGRKSGEEFACNFSPSLHSRSRGPISLIKSFSKANFMRVANGGPLTIELHDTMFRNDDSIEKVAKLVKTYMDIGGMQMQLNGVNRETMLDAQKHPEKHRDLIVRVWGWSGYFVELDKAYQDHIIKRNEFVM